MKKLFSTLALLASTFFIACGDNSSTNASGESNSADAEWRTHCLDIINEYRATEDVKALTLAPDEKQTCTDKQAAADLKANKAHGHFKDCGEFAQNSTPNISPTWASTETDIVEKSLERMWGEKELVESGERDPKSDADYPYIGHYLNMRNSAYSSVACGIARNSDGSKAWLNINFF